MSYDTEQQEEYQDAPADHTPLGDNSGRRHVVLVLLSHWLGFRLAADHVYASTIVYWKKVGMIYCILHDQTTKFRNTCTRRSHKTDLPDHVRGPKDHCHIGAGR
jgi:hypothetical protein